MIAKKRNGEKVEVYDAQAGVIKFLYQKHLGHFLLNLLVRPSVSRGVGHFMDSALSKCMIKRFVKSNNIDLSQYQKQSFSSYNDCFCRKIKPQMRPVSANAHHLVSPCDAKLSVCKIDSETTFNVKGHAYTVASLLRNKNLAKDFSGGTLAIFRLSVDDYHRYIFFDSGTFVSDKEISGVFHTVNPLAAQMRPIYKENARQYCLLESDNFGLAIQMEVGALLVGRIVNEPVASGARVCRGQEKGHFEFGGSTIILLFKKDAVEFDEDVILNSSQDVETIVKMGERIGKARKLG